MEDTTTLKIIYQSKGKTIDIDHLTYKQLIHRIIHAFKLKQRNYYHLYYRDHEGDFITVQTQQEFDVFIHSPACKKLYLDQIDDSNHHFLKIAKIVIKSKRPDVQQIFQANKDYFDRKWQQFKAVIQERIQKQMKAGIDQIYRKKQIHKNIFCARCPKQRPIEGPRYQCIRCDFNLCQNCEQQDDHMHPLIKILNESQAIASKRNFLQYEDNQLKEILKQRRKMANSAPKSIYF